MASSELLDLFIRAHVSSCGVLIAAEVACEFYPMPFHPTPADSQTTSCQSFSSFKRLQVQMVLTARSCGKSMFLRKIDNDQHDERKATMCWIFTSSRHPAIHLHTQTNNSVCSLKIPFLLDASLSQD